MVAWTWSPKVIVSQLEQEVLPVRHQETAHHLRGDRADGAEAPHTAAQDRRDGRRATGRPLVSQQLFLAAAERRQIHLAMQDTVFVYIPAR